MYTFKSAVQEGRQGVHVLSEGVCCKSMLHLGHPADVLLPVLWGEAKVLVQPCPDVQGL